jgi:hypothetical protein
LVNHHPSCPGDSPSNEILVVLPTELHPSYLIQRVMSTCVISYSFSSGVPCPTFSKIAIESPTGSLHVRDAVGDVDILTEAHRGRRDEDLCGSSDGVGGRVGGNGNGRMVE